MRSTILPVLAGLLVSVPLHAAPVRIEGGMVAVHNIVAPHRAAVEQSTGQQLEVKGTTGTKGLLALNRGECDLAVTAIPLDLMIAEAKAAGVALDGAEFAMHVVREDRLVFIVHPGNPVSALEPESLAAIYSGRITNWKEVGGDDLPIAVITDPHDSGTSALLRSRVLQGAAFGAKTTALSNLKLVANNVAANRNALGAVSSSFVVPGQMKTIAAETIIRPLGFVTKGPAGDEVRRVIEAYKALGR